MSSTEEVDETETTYNSSEIEDSSTESLPKPVFYKDEIIFNKYRVLQELGKGGCGIVLSVIDIDTEDSEKPLFAAMKAETIDPAGKISQTVKGEAFVLRRLQNCKNFCKLYLSCRLDNTINVMVMSLVGKSLSWLRRNTKYQRFTTSTAIRITLKCLEAIKELHKRGFIHRDVKASNFAMGAYEEDCRTVYLLDFGFARSYLKEYDNAMKIRPARKKAPYLGTDRYCSINVHRRGEHGRVDDLWSLLFMLVEFIKGKVPWKNVSSKKLAKAKTCHMDDLLKECPVELWKFQRHLQNLKYDSRPDYQLLENCLTDVCHRKGYELGDPYDWEEGGRHRQQVLEAFEHETKSSLKELPSYASTATENSQNVVSP
ncbi:unnamed protein product [Bursaphelenchus okinawaensis]|uniref:Protein kinase domain-containing protein n=1 Tax=Bursaphelenchus okinawaensis TaxID=465554 RepID=A0A811K4W2_9BILA|nr:unnamed protein product [Bursaphelenchus okinawaensis]CAG9092553.1 unnamed protein product [Bursaphelenchus okinawaensis]